VQYEAKRGKEREGERTDSAPRAGANSKRGEGREGEKDVLPSILLLLLKEKEGGERDDEMFCEWRWLGFLLLNREKEREKKEKKLRRAPRKLSPKKRRKKDRHPVCKPVRGEGKRKKRMRTEGGKATVKESRPTKKNKRGGKKGGKR